jgi:predicted transporter
LLAILTLLAGYIAIILLVIAAGAPLSDGPRNRLSEWAIAILACAAAVTLGLATLRRWRVSSR